MEEGDGGDGSGADFDFVGRVLGDELLGIDEGGKFFVVGNEVEGAEGLGDFVVGAAGEVTGIDGDIFEVMADEKEVGGKELGEFVEMDGFGSRCGSFWVLWRVGALVAEGGEGGDEEMEKLFVGGEVFDGGVEVVAKLFAEDTGSCAEGFGAGGEKGDC